VSYSAYCLHAFLTGLGGMDAELDDPIAHYPEDKTTAFLNVKKLKSEFHDQV
jgi:hypothetical protein